MSSVNPYKSGSNLSQNYSSQIGQSNRRRQSTTSEAVSTETMLKRMQEKNNYCGASVQSRLPEERSGISQRASVVNFSPAVVVNSRAPKSIISTRSEARTLAPRELSVLSETTLQKMKETRVNAIAEKTVEENAQKEIDLAMQKAKKELDKKLLSAPRHQLQAILENREDNKSTVIGSEISATSSRRSQEISTIDLTKIHEKIDLLNLKVEEQNLLIQNLRTMPLHTSEDSEDLNSQYSITSYLTQDQTKNVNESRKKQAGLCGAFGRKAESTASFGPHSRRTNANLRKA